MTEKPENPVSNQLCRNCHKPLSAHQLDGKGHSFCLMEIQERLETRTVFEPMKPDAAERAAREIVTSAKPMGVQEVAAIIRKELKREQP